MKVKFYSRVRDLVGVDSVELENVPRTVAELIEALSEKFGEDVGGLFFERDGKTLRSNLVLLVNGHSVRLLKGLQTPLKEGDDVSVDIIDIIELFGGG